MTCDEFANSATRPARPLEVLVYGSCVTRDVLRVTGNRFHLTKYIARQSWVSAFTPPLPRPEDVNLTSAFQRRSLIGDFTSNAADEIASVASRTDIVLLDIASDRHGVIAIDRSYVSATKELRASRILDNYQPAGRLDFGSERHLKLFRAAAGSLRKELERHHLFGRTLLLEFPFTDVSTDGERIPGKIRFTADETNRRYEPYYAVAHELGFRSVRLPERLAITTPEHKWGAAQDHFVDEAYVWWADRIVESFAGAQADAYGTG